MACRRSSEGATSLRRTATTTSRSSPTWRPTWPQMDPISCDARLTIAAIDAAVRSRASRGLRASRRPRFAIRGSRLPEAACRAQDRGLDGPPGKSDARGPGLLASRSRPHQQPSQEPQGALPALPHAARPAGASAPPLVHAVPAQSARRSLPGSVSVAGKRTRHFKSGRMINRSYFRDTPSGSSGGAGFLAGRGASSEYGLRQPEPNGWPGRGEKSVYRLMKARTGAALRQAPAQKKRGGRRATLLVPPRGRGLRRERPTYHVRFGTLKSAIDVRGQRDRDQSR